VQLTQDAWDYYDGIENQTAQSSYLASVIPVLNALKLDNYNVIGHILILYLFHVILSIVGFIRQSIHIFMEFSDQWWRGMTAENSDCIGLNNYIHSPCGAVATDILTHPPPPPLFPLPSSPSPLPPPLHTH